MSHIGILCKKEDMPPKRALLHYTRYTHLYLGIFISPALLFFAFTGALQTFSLHETTRGSNYKPPAWIVTLGQIHKKQTMVVPVRKLPPPAAQVAGIKGDKGQTAAALGPASPLAKVHNSLPLKLFFLLVSIGLFISTVSGLYMAYRYSRNRVLVTGLLVAGVVVPVVLIFL